MKIRHIGLFLGLCLLFNTGLFSGTEAAQSESAERYQRKSISYIPAIYSPSGEAYKMQPSETNFLVQTVREAIEMPRFDFNPLPEKISDAFLRATHDQDHLTLDKVGDLLESHIVPEILKILDAKKEMRAAELVSVEQQQQFIATKARELGITASQLEQVLNAAYLYFPFVDQVRFEEEKGMITCNLDGGIIWYHVLSDREDPTVELLLRETTGTFGRGKEGKSYFHAGQSLQGDEFALYTAVESFARNLEVITRSVPQFQLRGQIRYVQGSKVDFDLGRKEGVRVDDGFYIGEQYLKPDGKTVLRKVGFVRTTAVGRNGQRESNLSRGALVIGRRISRGMQTMEHPRLPIDVVVNFRMHPLQVTTGAVGVSWLDGAELLETRFTESYEGTTGSLDLQAQYHFGRHLGIPLFLITVGASYSPVPMSVDIKSYRNADWVETIPYVTQVRGGFVKKYAYRRFGLTFGGQFGVASMVAKEEVYDLDGEAHDLSLSNNTAGGVIHMGLELALTPDFHIGGIYGMQTYPESSSWSMNIDQDSYDLAPVYENYRPEFDISGSFIGLYFRYQPPSLPFDPWSLIRASTG